MIVEVVKDMKAFILMILVAILAFSEAYYCLSNNRLFENRIFTGYFQSVWFTFFNATGNYVMDGFEEDSIGWILFFLCTLFNMIVMLNLLIAIISETYNRVNQTKQQYALRERAGVVSDLRSFRYYKKFVKRGDPKNSLLIAIEEQAEGIDVDKSAITIFDVNERITDMKKELNGIKGLKKELKEIKHMLSNEQRQKLATEPTLMR